MPDCLFLDLTGIAHLFGDEPRLAHSLMQHLRDKGVAGRVAIADTLGAAWALASFAPAFPLPPSSFLLHPSGETLPALRPLPVRALRLEEDLVGLLRQLGIFTVGQLEGLPRDELSVRFGPQLLERWDQAMGALAEPLPGVPLLPEFQAEHVWEYPARRREAVEQALQELLEEVCTTLRAWGRGALRITCRLTCAESTPAEWSVGLFRAVAAPQRLFSLLQLQLESLVLRAPAAAVRVTVVATAPLVERQQELFSEVPARRDPRRLEELVERLSSRLGPQAVLRPRLLPDAQPEWAYAYDPLIGAEHGRKTARRTTPPLRPWRLLRRPQPIETLAVMPDGPPQRIHWAGRTESVVQSWGPERIETGWWRWRAAARDYYRVETAAGAQLWLFRRLDDGRWFWHGEF